MEYILQEFNDPYRKNKNHKAWLETSQINDVVILEDDANFLYEEFLKVRDVYFSDRSQLSDIFNIILGKKVVEKIMEKIFFNKYLIVFTFL